MLDEPCAVIEHEWVRPEGKPKITGTSPNLRQPIRYRGNRRVESRRATARPPRACNEKGQRDPGCRERQVEATPLLPSLPKRAGHKRSVIEQGRYRRGGHRLLGGHSQQARRHHACLPAQWSRRLDRPDEAIE